ncbi:MAG: hypothetical protein H0Z24_09460 [Thermosipho sp. (in: Bacteria)]|nr:hypothetical protein [Thermosipho sp. (in: thermotogales)]
MIGWNFPLNNDGEVDGFSNAGIETFRGNPWESLAREIIQNSLDAGLPGSERPVEVHFKLQYLPVDIFPDKDSFIEILNLCLDFWMDNAKTKKFFEKALNVMKLPKIPVLMISDYNTTGLTGSDEDHGTNWHNLIKSVGASDKSPGAGGSYGIGKHAPFACSQIRTVFYGTKDITGKTAFQGVSKLVTHRNKNGETTQGTGYYGVVKRNQPIFDYSKIDKFFYRNKIGTDIFIMGFNKGDNWELRIIKSVLENFFVAIKEDRLVVKVENTVINSLSLPDLLDEYINSDDNCLSGKYYKALVSPEKHYFYEDDFEGLGRIELYILPERDYPKRVAMVRNTGMKIYDKGHFRTPMKFAGVMIAKGSKMNEFLRSLEPPSHDDWQPERYEENPDYAQRILKKLNTWINEKVRSISFTNDFEELDIEGISQYLPDDLDEIPITSEVGKSEGERTLPKKVEIVDILPRNVQIITAAGSEAAAADEGNKGALLINRTRDNDSGGGNPYPEESEINEGNENGGSIPDQRGGTPTTSEKPINLKKIRIYCLSSDLGIYNVSFEPDLDGKGFLYVNIVGEVGREPAPIKSAVYKGSGERINIVQTGKIGPVKFKAEVRQTLVITLNDSLRCALEVSANEN